MSNFSKNGSSVVDTAMAFKDGYNIDAFGRLRASSPETLFDSKN